MSTGVPTAPQTLLPTEPADVVDQICALLPMPAAEVDRAVRGDDRVRLVDGVRVLNERARTRRRSTSSSSCSTGSTR